jgi:hypothetical protein
MYCEERESRVRYCISQMFVVQFKLASNLGPSISPSDEPLVI